MYQILRMQNVAFCKAFREKKHTDLPVCSNRTSPPPQAWFQLIPSRLHIWRQKKMPKLVSQNPTVFIHRNRGMFPPKWMVYFMENHIKMDDLEGFPIIFGETPISRVGRFWPVLSKPPKPWWNHQYLDPYMATICA